MRGTYGGVSYFAVSCSMLRSANHGCPNISSMPFAPRRVSLFLSSSLTIRSCASGETVMRWRIGSGKLTGLSRIRKYIRCLFLWKKGGMPTIISKMRMPRAHQSTVKSWPFPISISGAKYSAVPQNEFASSPYWTNFARPKSATRRYPESKESMDTSHKVRQKESYTYHLHPRAHSQAWDLDKWCLSSASDQALKQLAPQKILPGSLGTYVLPPNDERAHRPWQTSSRNRSWTRSRIRTPCLRGTDGRSV